jgi:mycothiol synthase
MMPKLRFYRDSSDYWHARDFSRELFRLDDRPGGNWHVALFDYWRWHWLENVVERSPDELCLWETGQGRIVAVLNQGDPGVCHIHVHPEFTTDALLAEMTAAAEREYSATYDGRRVVWVWTMEDDEQLHRVLARQGFAEQPEGGHSIEYNARRCLHGPIASAPLPDGFIVRSMGDLDELPKRSLASWRSFHPGESEDGCDQTGSWYRNVQRAPLYRRDLDVVAIAPNGDIASFALCYFDDVSRTGVFVLDGTAHQYQRLGLCKAAMTEALRRLQWLGAESAYVSWYEAPAGALYESVGFLEQRRGRAWVKRI